MMLVPWHGLLSMVNRSTKPTGCIGLSSTIFEERDGVEVSDSGMDVVPGDE